MTSVRTGTSHTEHANGDSDVHVLQIWALPRVDGLTPTYYTRQFTDAERKDNWAPTDDLSIKAEREVEWPTPVQATLHLDAALISFGVTAFLDRTNEQVSNDVGKIEINPIVAFPALLVPSTYELKYILINLESKCSA